MFKLFVFAGFLAVVAAVPGPKPGVVAAAYSAPVVSATAPVAYSARIAPVAYTTAGYHPAAAPVAYTAGYAAPAIPGFARYTAAAPLAYAGYPSAYSAYPAPVIYG